MRAKIEDTDALRALKPLELAAYLRSKGWTQQADLQGKAILWIYEGDGVESDVTVPLRREFADYALRVQEVLQTLSRVEQRSELDILRDLLTAAADLVRVRAPSMDGDSGSLPLEQGVQFVERSRDMVLAAACAALDKRAFFAKRKAQQAMDYLSHVRMGQTEHGSFVLTILSPVAPELRSAQEAMSFITEVSEPYERTVTRTLMQSLTSLDDAARTAVINGDMAPFQAAISQGVSANLCDAIVGLSEVTNGRGLDIQVSWARSRPVAESLPRHVFLAGDRIPVIKEAARHFRESAPLDDFEIVGWVKRLDRGHHVVEGEVTVVAPIDDQLRYVALCLDRDDYSKAVQAHEQRQTVRCVGDLVKEGRGFRLKNPRHFEILTGDEN
jgi:hypothetical protein